jgi:hypothetical protein
MKAIKLTSAIATLSLVLFISSASLADSAVSSSCELNNTGTKCLNIPAVSDKDYSYLRFDVDKYINEAKEADAILNSLDYLRFDVNDFMNENTSEAMELPVANQFEYLRFDASNFTESNPDAGYELPVNEFDYLRFDVNNFVNSNNTALDVLPLTE